jgi:hypothetical protein
VIFENLVIAAQFIAKLSLLYGGFFVMVISNTMFKPFFTSSLNIQQRYFIICISKKTYKPEKRAKTTVMRIHIQLHIQKKEEYLCIVQYER